MRLLPQISIVLIGCLMAFSSKGQPYYSKMYDVFGHWEGAYRLYKCKEKSNNRLAIIGVAINFGINDSTKHRNIFLSLLDDSGNIKTIPFILRENRYSYNPYQLYKIGNYNYLLFNKLNDSTGIGENYLIGLTNKGDTFNERELSKFNTDFKVSGEILLEKRTLCLLGYLDGINGPFSFFCYDTLGSVLLHRTYPGKRVRANNAVVAQDGNLLLAGVAYKGDTIYGWYAKMDTLGNFLWEKVMDGKQAFIAYYCYITQAGNQYFISGSNWSLPGFPVIVKDSSYAFVAKIDQASGNTLFRNNFLYTNPQLSNSLGSLVYKNNSLYAIMQYETTDGPSGFTQYLLLLKLDMDGKLIWQRRFKQWDRDNRGYSLTSTDDGFIICADGKDTTHTTGYTDAWIIKTDTNGCILPGCHLADGLVQLLHSENILEVYPNPATNEVHLQSKDERAKLSEVLVYDSKGNLLIHETCTHTAHHQLQTTTLANGQYYVVIALQSGERAIQKIIIQH
jgi:hypothetical protein